MNYQTLCLLLSVLLLAACKKNNSNDPQPTSDSLLKTWKVESDVYAFGTKSLPFYNRTGDQTKNLGDLSAIRYTFKADNTYVVVYNSNQESGTWVFQNNNLTLTESVSKTADTYQVEKLDGSTLILSQTTSASALTTSDIDFFKRLYNVDASGGFKETATLSPN